MHLVQANERMGAQVAAHAVAVLGDMGRVVLAR
jgi:hypothetical protein